MQFSTFIINVWVNLIVSWERTALQIEHYNKPINTERIKLHEMSFWAVYKTLAVADGSKLRKTDSTYTSCNPQLITRSLLKWDKMR